LKVINPIRMGGVEVLPLVEGGKGVAVSNGATSGGWASGGGVGTFSGVNADSYDAEGRIIRQIYHGKTRRDRHEELVEYGIKGGIARERRVDGRSHGRSDGRQLKLELLGASVHEGDRLWEYAVMVTDVAYPIEAIGQLYRDRADCENGFDELKNQWGLSGFTTQDINRCQTTARACALVYNWWSWYCRAATPTARMEAITSRPLLLAAVGRAAHSGGQTTLYLTPMHGKTKLLKSLIANIHAALQHVKAAAEQFKSVDRWATLLRYISERIAPAIGPFSSPAALPETG
jgi:hypothetical protein